MPPVPKLAPPRPAARVRRLLVPLRFAVFACLLGWGYYIAAVFRGSEAGSSLPLLCLVAAIFVGPLAAIGFVGLRWRHYCAVLAIVVVLPALTANALFTFEERRFVASVRAVPPATATVFKTQRWWPNGTSYLSYEPSTGELGGGD